MDEKRVPIRKIFLISLVFFGSTESWPYYDDNRSFDIIDFNVVCNFKREVEKESKDGFERCEAVAHFSKRVSDCGEEVKDRSTPYSNPKFGVRCDGKTIYEGSSHRFTDSKGTRIQAEGDAFPAIVLPPGALKDEYGYRASIVELGDQWFKGYCFIYTGPKLN